MCRSRIFAGIAGKKAVRANNDNDLRRRKPRWPPSTPGLYFVLATGIALAAIRLFVWMLNQEGLVSEEDGNGMVLIALPVALFAIAWLAPRNAL